jgi:hypothetical protein
MIKDTAQKTYLLHNNDFLRLGKGETINGYLVYALSREPSSRKPWSLLFFPFKQRKLVTIQHRNFSKKITRIILI